MKQQPINSGFGPASTAADVIAGIDLSGKVAIVTGGSSGLGRETVRAFLGAGARVIVPARDVGRATAAMSALPGAEIELMNLLDPTSIDAFAVKVVASDQPLHILVNNAGIMAGPLLHDRRGFEHQFATNHRGHFQLTIRLWPALLRSKQSRVISVASRGHWFPPVIFDDPWQAYGQSKTANILFAVELDRMARSRNVRAFSAHPGAVVETGLARHVATDTLRKAGEVDEHGKTVIDPAKGMKTVEQGASIIVWCATSLELNGLGGGYCEDNDIASLSNEAAQHSSSSSSPEQRKGVKPYAVDPNNARRLWALSEDLLGFKTKIQPTL